MRWIKNTAEFAFGLFLMASSAVAAPVNIIYALDGGTGSLGGVDFSTSRVTFTISSNTDLAANFTFEANDVWYLPGQSAEIEIAGLGKFELLEQSYAAANHINNSTSFGVFSSRPTPPDELGYSVLFSQDFSRPGYRFETELSQRTGSNAFVNWGLNPVRTSGGILSFETAIIPSASFEVAFASTPAPVPLPASSVMLFSAFAVLRLVKRKRGAT